MTTEVEKNNPLISILMPVYNAEQYLSACLDSILGQSESHWELLAIDDFSSDGSLPILRKYGAADRRIQVFQNTNKGIVPALKQAFRNSKGGLITRMDADDLMERDKLSELKRLLLETGPGHVSTGLVQYFSDERLLGNGYYQYQEWLNQLCLEERNFEEIYRECVIPSPCWMVGREDLINCGAFEPDTYPEDYDLCFRFYQAGLKVIGSTHLLHHWRDYPGRTSRTDHKYADQRYFDLKLAYFVALEYNADRPLVLWGAGKKAKRLAGKMQEQGLLFKWITNNPKKIGHRISGILLQHYQTLADLDYPMVIVCVSAPNGKEEIRSFLTQKGMKAGEDLYFFC